jgi:guanine deaminase
MNPPPASTLAAYRGTLVHFLGDPGHEPQAAMESFADGLLIVEDGLVKAAGHYEDLRRQIPSGHEPVDYRGCIILPGFVDTHIHYVQTDVIASPGRDLLDWLERYTFPAERRFADPALGRTVAEFFLDELIRNGTTTALVYGSVHKASVDAFFEAAQARGMRMIAGKSLMDRNCPPDLRDTPESGYRDTAALLERWDGVDRLNCAITIRFAATSSPRQFERTAELARAYPNAHIHSHVAENVDEIAWVRRLFPERRSYLDVYDHYGLLRPRAVYAHCIHLDQVDRARMGASGAAAAFSPTSNLFLGSGLFDLAASDAAGMRVGMATDVGGGTSFSMLRTLAEAYKVVQLTGQRMNAARAFYFATLGGARALGLDERIGSFSAGREADFVVLDPAATPIAARRARQAQSIEEQLFLLMILGDDRSVRATAIGGRIARPAIP